LLYDFQLAHLKRLSFDSTESQVANPEPCLLPPDNGLRTMPRAINPNHSNNIREKKFKKKKKTTITWCMPKAICWSLLRTKHSILYTMYDTIDVNTLFFKQTIDAHHDLKQCLLYACVAMFMKRRISHMLNHVGNLQTSSPLTSSMHDRESINDCTKYCTLKYFCD